MTFFTPNGTTKFARHSDETRIQTFVRKICASTLAGTSRCRLACFAFYSGRRYVNAVMSLWLMVQLDSGNLAKTIPYSIPRYVPALELFGPACPVIDLTQPWFVVVIHGMIVEIPHFLMSTAAEAVEVKGVCLADSVGKGTCWPTVYADVSRSSL